MAPMTRNMSLDGVPGRDVAEYYRQRAEGGAGLILSEGTVVNRPASRNMSAIPFFHGTDALAGWKRVIEAVHGAGGAMGPQIWHVGASRSMNDWEPEAPVESPSGLAAPGDSRGNSMTVDDIDATIDAFAKAAQSARDLGFDLLELHGAHGYLIDQFFWAATNQRQDIWGGARIEQRASFAVALVRAVRDRVGPDFPIILRISQFKERDFDARNASSPQELGAWLCPLAEAGVDMFHCSQRRFWDAAFPDVDGENGLNLAGWIKKVTGKPTISVGSVGLSGDFLSSFSGSDVGGTDLQRLVERMDRDEFDMIAVGRAMLSNPDWANKVKAAQFDQLAAFDRTVLDSLF